MNIVSSTGIFIAMEEICLDRLLKQRSALPDVSFDFPPQRGGLRSLSGGAVCIAAAITNVFRTLIPGPTNS
jgi:hypothetical protein